MKSWVKKIGLKQHAEASLLKHKGGSLSALLLAWFLVLSNYPEAMAAETDLGLSSRELIERLTRIETKVEEGLKNLERRIDDTRKETDELKNFVLWGFGITFMGMFALVSFVIWDRRTALAPTMNQVEELRRKERDLEEVLRKYAVKDPELAGIMRSLGLL